MNTLPDRRSFSLLAYATGCRGYDKTKILLWKMISQLFTREYLNLEGFSSDYEGQRSRRITKDEAVSIVAADVSLRW